MIYLNEEVFPFQPCCDLNLQYPPQPYGLRGWILGLKLDYGAPELNVWLSEETVQGPDSERKDVFPGCFILSASSPLWRIAFLCWPWSSDVLISSAMRSNILKHWEKGSHREQNVRWNKHLQHSRNVLSPCLFRQIFEILILKKKCLPGLVNYGT